MGGAEKALFRALKMKKDTPKYGLIYHAHLVGQCTPRFKGKISRVLAAKCSLSIRVDALGESTEATIGIEGRAKVEARLRHLLNTNHNAMKKAKPHETVNREPKKRMNEFNIKTYNSITDVHIPPDKNTGDV